VSSMCKHSDRQEHPHYTKDVNIECYGFGGFSFIVDFGLDNK